MLENGDTVWVAPEDQITPHLEVKFTRDEFDRASLENAITARIGGETIPIGPLELQIAYKLYLGTISTLKNWSGVRRQRRCQPTIRIFTVVFS